LTRDTGLHDPDVDIDEHAIGRLITSQRFALWEQAAQAEQVPLTEFVGDVLDRAADVILQERRSGGTGTI
jgi:hypothetical protein